MNLHYLLVCGLAWSFSAGYAYATDSEASMWVEPNFVDTQYSVLFESLELAKAETDDAVYDHVPFGWIPYYLQAKVVDVYKGDFERNQILDLLVYIPVVSSGYQMEAVRGRFILSFCRSGGGIYYNSRDYLIKSATPANIGKFESVRRHGSDYEGSGDCSGNYPSLNPDTHQ